MEERGRNGARGGGEIEVKPQGFGVGMEDGEQEGPKSQRFAPNMETVTEKGQNPKDLGVGTEGDEQKGPKSQRFCLQNGDEAPKGTNPHLGSKSWGFRPLFAPLLPPQPQNLWDFSPSGSPPRFGSQSSPFRLHPNPNICRIFSFPFFPILGQNLGDFIPFSPPQPQILWDFGPPLLLDPTEGWNG